MGRIAKAVKKIMLGRAVRYLNRERKAANYYARDARDTSKESKERTIQARDSLRAGLIMDSAGDRNSARAHYNEANRHFDRAAISRRVSRIAATKASSIRSQARENARIIAGRNSRVRKRQVLQNEKS